MSKLLDLLSNIPTVAVLKERIALIREQAQALEKQIEKLESEVAALKKQNAELHAQLAAKSRAEEFVEHRGALFKRKPDGTYHLAVYCPICHMPTGAIDDGIPFACTNRCGWIGWFTPCELPKIIAELSA